MKVLILPSSRQVVPLEPDTIGHHASGSVGADIVHYADVERSTSDRLGIAAHDLKAAITSKTGTYIGVGEALGVQIISGGNVHIGGAVFDGEGLRNAEGENTAIHVGGADQAKARGNKPAG